jgi:hypothetical protein
MKMIQYWSKQQTDKDFYLLFRFSSFLWHKERTCNHIFVVLPKQKYRQDISFMKFLTVRAETLCATYLYMGPFPPEIQVTIEIWFKNKPVNEDVSGLLSFIMMFAGIGTNEDLYFKNQIIDTFHLSDTMTRCYKTQQNLSDLLLSPIYR